jgi:integrase
VLRIDSPGAHSCPALNAVGSHVIAGQRAGMDGEKPRADLNKPWRSIAKRAGLAGLRIHDLRHTHASFGAGAGLGLPIIGKLLGHKNAGTTQRYAHLDTDPLRRASEHIGGRLAMAMGEPAPNAGASATVVAMKERRG